MIEIYSPLNGATGTTYFGAEWAYDAELPDDFDFKQEYLEVMRSTSVDNRKRIGKRIQQLREEAGLSQEELAQKCGLVKQNISRIEQGKYSTGQDILSRIATALGMRLDFVEDRQIRGIEFHEDSQKEFEDPDEPENERDV
jgi:DNA-binding XRE family transcriptional regulator